MDGTKKLCNLIERAIMQLTKLNNKEQKYKKEKKRKAFI